MIKLSLKAVRVNANMTQSEAAKAAGVCKSTIIHWETGKTSPTVEQLRKLCGIYGVPVDVISFLPN